MFLLSFPHDFAVIMWASCRRPMVMRQGRMIGWLNDRRQGSNAGSGSIFDQTTTTRQISIYGNRSCLCEARSPRHWEREAGMKKTKKMKKLSTENAKRAPEARTHRNGLEEGRVLVLWCQVRCYELCMRCRG